MPGKGAFEREFADRLASQIAIIVFVPVIDRLVYPLLRKMHIPFPPINRIVVGFWVAAAAMAYAAIVQHLIYSYASLLSPEKSGSAFSDKETVRDHVTTTHCVTHR